MPECKHCSTVIGDPEKAIYDGAHWFCSHQCLGQWAMKNSGNVPA